MSEVDIINFELAVDHPEWDIVVKVAEGVLHFKGTNLNGYVVRRSITYNQIHEPTVIKAIALFDKDLTIAKHLTNE